MKNLFKKLMLTTFSCLFLSCGCVEAIKKGNIIEVDSTVFGFNISSGGGATATPNVQLGLIRQKILLIPTSTNKLTAPDYYTSGDINNNSRTLIFGGSDASASGNGTIVFKSTNNLLQVLTNNTVVSPTNTMGVLKAAAIQEIKNN